ncbi:MAG TPA: PGPGW domain-containing protein [Marmoricola sp.]|nr:PGPGW domain-containing protein [Marmoricola sp.]
MLHHAKRMVLVVLGWVLVLGGIAALVLPGPGLLALFAGLALLSQEYDWARRRVEPVKQAAFRAATEGVQTWPRIMLSLLGVCCLLALGGLWIWRPPPPGWWPVHEDWWLVGGWVAGATLVASALIALGLLVYSIRRFRGAGVPQREGVARK